MCGGHRMMQANYCRQELAEWLGCATCSLEPRTREPGYKIKYPGRIETGFHPPSSPPLLCPEPEASSLVHLSP
jgi:hypothetical protein